MTDVCKLSPRTQAHRTRPSRGARVDGLAVGPCGPAITCERTEAPVPFLLPLMKTASQAEEGVSTQGPRGSACGPTSFWRFLSTSTGRFCGTSPWPHSFRGPQTSDASLRVKPEATLGRLSSLLRTDGSRAPTLAARTYGQRCEQVPNCISPLQPHVNWFDKCLSWGRSSIAGPPLPCPPAPTVGHPRSHRPLTGLARARAPSPSMRSISRQELQASATPGEMLCLRTQGDRGGWPHLSCAAGGAMCPQGTSSASNKGCEALVPVARPPQGHRVFTCLQAESCPQTPSGPSSRQDSAKPFGGGRPWWDGVETLRERASLGRCRRVA